MEYIPISPFKRPISHAHLRAHPGTDDTQGAPGRGKPVNKWALLRELSKAQAAFGISERDLTVLQGLLSFFPGDAFDGTAAMVVFPSNKAICERLNGMPCSTMRRHLSRLIDVGMLLRRDSPNGKRYVRRHGPERIAFGIDLSPLYRRHEEIVRAADAMRAAEDHIRRRREIVSLMRRDLAALADFGETMQPGLGLWDLLRDTAALTARALRRKLPAEALQQIQAQLETLLDRARDIIDGPETENLITNDARIEQHHQNSDKDSLDLEPATEKSHAADNPRHVHPEERDQEPGNREAQHLPNLPLHLVIAGCPSLRTFYPREVRHWHQLYDAACQMRAAMGISASAWEHAQRCMGPEQAAIVVLAMLERFEQIKSPGGYLRALTQKAAAGTFSCGPMIMALIGRKSAA